MDSKREQPVQVIEVPRSGRSWKRRWTPRLVAWAIVLALLVLFIAQNFDFVEVRMVAWDVETRLAWALLIAGAFGFLLGLLRPRFRR